MKLFKKYIFLFYLNIILSQLVPYEEPLLIQNTYNEQIPKFSIFPNNMNQELNIDIIQNGKLYKGDNINHIFYSIDLFEDNIYNLFFDYEDIPLGTKLFIIENNKFIGPILIEGSYILNQRVSGKDLTLEIVIPSNNIENLEFKIHQIHQI